jgi:hypothetical protein
VESLRDELFFRAAWLVPFTALVVFVLGQR